MTKATQPLLDDDARAVLRRTVAGMDSLNDFRTRQRQAPTEKLSGFVGRARALQIPQEPTSDRAR